MKTIILIGDEQVKKIPVQESNEPIVDLQKEFQELKFALFILLNIHYKILCNGKVSRECN